MTTSSNTRSVVLPGDRIAQRPINPKADGPKPTLGTGLHVSGSHSFSSHSGMLINDATEVRVRSDRVQPKLPYVDAIVLARVTRTTSRQAHVSILAVDNVPCTASTDNDVGFGGMIRVQDVRATEKDKVTIVESFSVGDVIRATVISIGDERNYYLSTARNELGVVMAKSTDTGMPMFPVSWKDVVDDSGLREARKVAKPDV